MVQLCHRVLALTCAVLALALACSSSPASAQNDGLLAAKLTDLVRAAGLGDNLGVVVANATTGVRLYSLNPEVPRNPASNMKLVTAAAALAELGADYRMRTTLSGAVSADGGVETLVLRGEGDPSLAYEDLLSLSRGLVEQGVRRVENIVVDGSYFDAEALPPAFDQQPSEVASFRAAVGAVSVDRNAFVLRVAPGPAVEAPANVLLLCPDHFSIESSMTTAAAGTPRIVADQRQQDDKLALKLSGSVPLGVRGVSYQRRIESPLPYAGHCLRAALRAQRVSGGMRVRVGNVPSGLGLLASHESEPLSSVLLPVGKNSDNFSAEMLLKVVGAHAGRGPGSSARGAERAQALLEQAGVPRGAATIVNGSGLFHGNNIAPDHIVKVLVYAQNNPALRSEYTSQLAVGGTDGTLHTRLTGLSHPRIVRAKTGTLDDVIALSGYVLGPRSDATLAFSFLLNGVRGKQSQARALADDMVRVLADYLYQR